MKLENKVQEAIDYFIRHGFIDELTSDKQFYVKQLIDFAKVKSTQQEVLRKVLRDKYNIDIEIQAEREVKTTKAKGYKGLIVTPAVEVYSDKLNGLHDSYEKALETTLIYALRLIPIKEK